MTTIKKEVQISSVSLMSGIDSTVRLVPSNKKGIRFYLGGKSILAHIDNVVSTDHCTVIGNQEIKVALIEHFMAACSICNIDSLDVYLTHYEMPILDGSSKDWVELFNSEGIEQSKKVEYKVVEPVQYINGKTHLVVLPSDKLAITYSVNFNHPDLSNRWVSLNHENIQEITEARTFGYLKELEMLQQAGFAKGVTVENTIGLTDTGYTTNLRSSLEPVKHKILDLIGDFSLTGVNPLNLKAEIIVKEAGHAVHCIIAKLLKDKIVEEK